MAEITETLDTIRADIVAEKDKWLSVARDAHQRAEVAIGQVEAHDRAVAATQYLAAPGPPAAPRERHGVQRVVMAAIENGPAGSLWTEKGLVGITGLPAASVHDFLLRAVRQGKLVVDGGVYKPPPPPSVWHSLTPDIDVMAARERGDEAGNDA